MRHHQIESMTVEGVEVGGDLTLTTRRAGRHTTWSISGRGPAAAPPPETGHAVIRLVGGAAVEGKVLRVLVTRGPEPIFGYQGAGDLMGGGDLW